MENIQESKSGIDKLKSKLGCFGIDTSIWGTSGYKTLDHLMKEIECGEAVLGLSPDSELIRISEVVAATIFYRHTDGSEYRLKELKQIFEDGRERVRPSAGQSVFEKMKFGENPSEAMLRGISEELGIGEVETLNYIDKIENLADSKSYPGLKTQSTTHLFEVRLNAEQFNPQGYVERQMGLTTYFIWELIK